jgi:hypothetical protein
VETYSNSLKISRKAYSPTWKLNTSINKQLPAMPRCAMQFNSHTWLPAHGAYSTLNSSIWSNPLHQQPKPIISCPCTKLKSHYSCEEKNLNAIYHSKNLTHGNCPNLVSGCVLRKNLTSSEKFRTGHQSGINFMWNLNLSLDFSYVPIIAHIW